MVAVSCVNVSNATLSAAIGRGAVAGDQRDRSGRSGRSRRRSGSTCCRTLPYAPGSGVAAVSLIGADPLEGVAARRLGPTRHRPGSTKCRGRPTGISSCWSADSRVEKLSRSRRAWAANQSLAYSSFTSTAELSCSVTNSDCVAGTLDREELCLAAASRNARCTCVPMLDSTTGCLGRLANA